MFQLKPTEKACEKCSRLFNYIVTFPNVILRYQNINMHLYVDSVAVYLVVSKALSQITLMDSEM